MPRTVVCYRPHSSDARATRRRSVPDLQGQDTLDRQGGGKDAGHDRIFNPPARRQVCVSGVCQVSVQEEQQTHSLLLHDGADHESIVREKGQEEQQRRGSSSAECCRSVLRPRRNKDPSRRTATRIHSRVSIETAQDTHGLWTYRRGGQSGSIGSGFILPRRCGARVDVLAAGDSAHEGSHQVARRKCRKGGDVFILQDVEGCGRGGRRSDRAAHFLHRQGVSRKDAHGARRTRILLPRRGVPPLRRVSLADDGGGADVVLHASAFDKGGHIHAHHPGSD